MTRRRFWYSGGGTLVSAPVAPIVSDGKIFRTAGGTPWRYRGVSAFKLLARWAADENIQPFLDAYRGFNVLRVWPYVEWGPDKSWSITDPATINAFIANMNRRGWYVEFTLLTDDAPARLQWAKDLIPRLERHPGLLLEGGNEPTTNKNIDTPALRDLLAGSGFPYASGDYENSARAYGSYGVAHTARTADWPRRAHDLMEFYGGGGPNTPQDPSHPYPWVGDEPAKPQDVSPVAADWRAYFGTCAILGAGGTFHCESAKWADLPDPTEAAMAKAALDGLYAFAADAPLGPYRRIVEPGQPDYGRTYVVGDCMTRCQQNGTAAPEPGWTSLDADGILWKR